MTWPSPYIHCTEGGHIHLSIRPGRGNDKVTGGWASDCYKRYIDVSIDKRYDSMKAFVEALNNLTAE